jgi:hypothetical protein
VVSHAGQFSSGNAEWLPATSGGWGVGHLGVAEEYGAVISCERAKEAPVAEEEDAHGILAKATIGSERQSIQLRTVLRVASPVATGDALTIAGLVWYVISAQTIWAAGEWAELVIQARRWPSLPRVRTFAAQQM